MKEKLSAINTHSIVMVSLLLVFTLFEILSAYQLIKKADLNEILNLHSYYAKQVSESIPTDGSIAFERQQRLLKATASIKQQSMKCMEQKTLMSQAFSRLISGHDIFNICLMDRMFASQILEATEQYKQQDITDQEQISFLRNIADKLDHSTANKTSFLEDLATGLFTSFALFALVNMCAILVCIYYFYVPSARSYKKLQWANEQLKETEQRLWLFLKATNAGIWDTKDIDKDEVYWSPRMKEILGYGVDVNPSHSLVTDIVHPNHRQKLKDLRRAAYSQSLIADELMFKTKEEGYRWFRVRAIGSIDSITKKYRLTGSIVNIDNQKLVEQRLSQSMTFMQLVLDHIPDMVFVQNREHRVIVANQAYFAEYPRSLQEERLRDRRLNPQKYSSIDEDDQAAFKEGYSESIQVVTLPSGRTRNFHSRKIRFESAEKEQLILVIAHDITDTEDLISQVTKSNQDLEQFAFIASHDLQEPLRMIDSFTGLLKERIEPQLDNESTEYLRIIQLSASRLQSLIRDLLIYAKLNDDDIQGYEEIDANYVAQEVLDNYQHRLEESKASLTFDFLPTLWTRKSLLRLLISNLVSNAIKYQSANSSPKIHISVNEDMETWVFCVEDNGIGFDTKYSEVIFMPFKRLHRKEEYMGTGIGLAICRKVVDRLGGEIWSESSPGKGSRFFFKLPKKPHI